MEYNLYLILFIINLLFYLLSFLLVFQQINYSSLSIRSPKLILLSSLSSFLSTSSLITYEFLDDFSNITNYHFLFCNFIPFCFLILHFIQFVSIIFRIHRIIQCCSVNTFILHNTKSKAKTFFTKRFLIQQKFYIRLFTLIIGIIFIVIGLFFLSENGKVVMPFHFISCPSYGNYSNMLSSLKIRNIIFLIEGIAIITYIYKLYFTHLKFVIKIEFIMQLVSIFMYFHIVKYVFDILSVSFHSTTVIVLCFNYFNTLCNSYVPFIYSVVDKVKLNYHFNPKLTSNLYLFLSDEICYYSFSNMMKSNPTDNFYICLYTQIMKFKYKYSLEANFYKILDDAKDLFEKYFSSKANNTYMGDELLGRIRSSCEKLIAQNECKFEMFDDALVNVYAYLESRLNEYRKTDEYQTLADELNLNAYLQQKMCVIPSKQTPMGY